MNFKVAISGKFCSGKDTLTDAIIEKYGGVKIAFAGNLKRLALLIRENKEAELYETYKNLYNIGTKRINEIWQTIKGELYDLSDRIPFSPPKDREFLQKLGDLCRSYYRPVFTESAIREANKHNKVIISDLRLKEEARALKQAGYKLIRIQSDLAINRERYKIVYGEYPAPEREQHFTEIDLDDWQEWDLGIDGSLPMQNFIEAGLMGFEGLLGGKYQRVVD